MTLALRYAARTDVGLLREGNEDAMYAGPRLLAVADGMGGHAAGEVASRVVIETVAALDSRPPADGELTAALRGAVETANDYLRDMVAADSALEGMGTTLTALLWVGQQLGLVHVGDSRAYLFGAFGGSGLEGTQGWMESMRLRPGAVWARAAVSMAAV